jgi:hypothetical protein
MNDKHKIWFILLIVSFFVTNCSVVKNKNAKVFNVEDAYYQSWMYSTEEKGTDIMVYLSNVQDEVEFDSLIFRGVSLPVFVSENNMDVVLKSILNTGISKISVVKKPAGKPDQLIYYFKGSKYSYPLKNIRRKEMKYN